MEAFIAEEQKGKAILDAYHNTFKDRFIHLSTEEELAQHHFSPHSLSEDTQKQKQELKELMHPLWELDQQMQTIQEIAQGVTKIKSLVVDGFTIDKHSLEAGYSMLQKKRMKFFDEHFKAWDTAFIALHKQIAKQLGRTTELENLLNQQEKLSTVYRSVSGVKGWIENTIQELQVSEEVAQEALNSFSGGIIQELSKLNELVAGIVEASFVPMPNISTVKQLHLALIPSGAFEKPPQSTMFSEGGIGIVMHQLEQSQYFCQRVEQKNLSLLLTFNEDLQQALVATTV